MAARRTQTNSEIGARFKSELTAVLRERGMTQKEAARRSALSEGTLLAWGHGTRSPYRESLARLAHVLDAPQLLALLPHRPKQLAMTCRVCGETKLYMPALVYRNIRKARRERKMSGFKDAKISRAKGVGSYVCSRDIRSARMTQYMARLKRNHGKKALVARGKALAATLGPEERRRFQALASESNKGRVRQPDVRQRMSAAKIKAHHHQDGKHALCRVCGRYTFTYFSTLRHQSNQIAETHDPCRKDWLTKRGLPLTSLEYPPRRPGRPVPSDELADSLEIAVRRLLRDEDPEILAEEFGLADTRSIRRRVTKFIELLPDDRVANGVVRRWVRALRSAREASREE